VVSGPHWQDPEAQTPSGPQRAPQAPQFLGSVAAATHAPPQASWSLGQTSSWVHPASPSAAAAIVVRANLFMGVGLP
jgi:hypothetical protein